MNQRTSRILTPVLATLFAASGCGDESIRTYRAPKEAPPAASRPSTHSHPAEVAAWDLPHGWTERPGEGMRFATLIADPTEPPLEVRVTPLGRIAEDPLANINRWRGQIGLEPITDDEIGSVAEVVELTGDRQALKIDMEGDGHDDHPAQRILAAIFPGEERVWFFLMMADATRVAGQVDAFDALTRSLRLETAERQVPRGELAAGDAGGSGGGLPEGHPPIGGAGAADPPSDESGAGASEGAAAQPPAASGESLTWTLPEGWEETPNTSSMRVATIQAGDTEVAITRFPGAVGSLVDNVNRWRSQLGLEPVATADDQPMEHFDAAGVHMELMELAGPNASSQAMLVVICRRSDMTWFVKMTGDGAAVDAEHRRFRTFAESLRFQSDT